ncbi:MAG: UPF0280 family protein [Beijerinckiaceae bacterium]
MSGWARPQVGELADGRLHLQHGPIDLVIGATGEANEIRRARRAAIGRFETILIELTGDLPFLRCALLQAPAPGEAALSPVACRMVAACQPHATGFITPMAAVAGAVADEIRDVMLAASPGLLTLHVNNGGDISLHVAAGAELRIGVVSDLVNIVQDGVITVAQGVGGVIVGGLATSGWRGRSLSLGIADAATVLARSAAEADAAATIIGNAVNVVHSAIRRAPARSLDPDSDLGDRLVTVDVGPLPEQAIEAALDNGTTEARRLLDRNLILGAVLALAGRHRIMADQSHLVAAPILRR